MKYVNVDGKKYRRAQVSHLVRAKLAELGLMSQARPVKNSQAAAIIRANSLFKGEDPGSGKLLLEAYANQLHQEGYRLSYLHQRLARTKRYNQTS